MWIKPLCVTIQMKAIEQYFYVVLFIMLYNAVLTYTFKSGWNLVCDHQMKDTPLCDSILVHKHAKKELGQ